MKLPACPAAPRKRTRPIGGRLLLCLGLLPAVFSFPAAGQTYWIDWHKIAGGGGTSTNAQFSLSGTIGQPDGSGAMSSGNFSVTGGYWSLVNVVQTPGAPTLVINLTGNQAIVSWPTSVTGWTLQTNSNLATGNWVDYTGPTVNNRVTNSPPTGKLFFRLKH